MNGTAAGANAVAMVAERASAAATFMVNEDYDDEDEEWQI